MCSRKSGRVRVSCAVSDGFGNGIAQCYQGAHGNVGGLATINGFG